MSKVNIRRLVENIRSGTNSYTPLIEMTVNAIQAIDQSKRKDGLIEIHVLRNAAEDMLDRLRPVDGFAVIDNGIGFTQQNRDAFDTVYTEQKLPEGGKGFGRFTYLKYFERVQIESIYSEGDAIHRRAFRMGLDSDIIIAEEFGPAEGVETKTRVEVSGIRRVQIPDKGLETIGRIVVERLLPYFVDEARPCPRILLREADDPKSAIVLNDYLGKGNSQIVEIRITNGEFALQERGKEYDFIVRLFKFYSPRSERSKISLVAHRREVTSVPMQDYIPEFAEEFLEVRRNGEAETHHNYILKAYAFGDYLNENVALERGEFRFQQDPDIVNEISQGQIEGLAARIAEEAVGSEVTKRRERKSARIADYITTQAPWHKGLANEVNFDSLPMRPSNQDIEMHLQRAKLEKEVKTRASVSAILASESPEGLDGRVSEVIANISETSKSDLIHYVSMRRCALDIFGKLLEAGDDGKHKSEASVHDLIMPRKKDSEGLDYSAHNLWILDERLNFTEYISSDKPLEGKVGDRTDITVYGRKIAFRGENEASNPITIFEFKKPQRDDFANPSSDDDPVEQIIRYVNQIRDGKFKTPKRRDILVNDSTPFYGYVVCDMPQKVHDWLRRVKNFTPMADGLGWFQWYGNINLYIEVLSWTKLLRDAEMRNRIFFHKLGLD